MPAGPQKIKFLTILSLSVFSLSLAHTAPSYAQSDAEPINNILEDLDFPEDVPAEAQLPADLSDPILAAEEPALTPMGANEDIQPLLPEEPMLVDETTSLQEEAEVQAQVEADAAANAAQEDGAEMDAPPTAMGDDITIIDTMEAPATPSNDALSEPAIVETVSPEMQTPQIPGAAPGEEEFDEDLFFDAEALVPQSELARKGVPSKVNPKMNPGSRLIVTRTTHGASSRQARLVAAERATKLGRYESALEIYNGLYASNKRDPNILMGRAVTLQQLGRADEALQAYEELLSLRPNYVEAQINMHGLISELYPAVALRKLLEIHNRNPGNTSVVAQIAVVQARLGQYQDAIRYLGVAASMEPENAGHVYNMAVIADRAGAKDQAIEYYESALEIDNLYGSGRSIPRQNIFQRLAQLR